MYMRTRLILWILLVPFLLALNPGALAQGDKDEDAPQVQRDKAAESARETEMSSSKDTRIDLSPPKEDAKNHPNSGAAIMDSEGSSENSDVDEMHAWDPHRAAKDIEVGDYYFKRKNYRGALERYKDALTYKPNDAVANFRLADCEEKVGNNTDAAQHYEAYLKILPNGPFAADAQKAIERLKSTSK
jgi:tetratricopeptide (TPR) repeat protein